MENPNWVKDKKVALVCDWLTTYGGAEKVVKTVSDIFPEAPIFTMQYSEKKVDWFKGRDVRVGCFNIFPDWTRKFISVFRAIYFSRLGRKLKQYDVIISITTAESKGLKLNKNQLHISYLQGPPTQYFWGMYDDYVKNPGFGPLNFLVRFCFKLLVGPMRKIDYKMAQRPDYLVANSSYSATEIEKYYNRSSYVIFPPVETDKFKISKKTGDFFISTSRQVNWKRLDIAVEAFKQNKQKLVLVGDGAEHEKLKMLAENCENIEFIPFISDSKELGKLVSQAKGFIFPSLEPFGIAPIEALSAGVPVIAYNQGGALDYINSDNGVFFDEQSVLSLKNAVDNFNKINFSKSKVSASAKKFNRKNFEYNFENFIREEIDEKFN